MLQSMQVYKLQKCFPIGFQSSNVLSSYDLSLMDKVSVEMEKSAQWEFSWEVLMTSVNHWVVSTQVKLGLNTPDN